MAHAVNPDDIPRAALLWLHDDSEPTLEAALAKYAETRVLICASSATCDQVSGQAALTTAVITAVRSFGCVQVFAERPYAPITIGTARGLTVTEVIEREGAQLVSRMDLAASDTWPAVLIGADTVLPAAGRERPLLSVSWSGWVARVSATEPGESIAVDECVLAAIAASAIGINEAFGAAHPRAGSDVGFRTVELNLWNPAGRAEDDGPTLAHAPHAWWLVGLGHLGQAYAWVISWLSYADRSSVEVVLQDTDLTTPANHSTSVLTPRNSNGLRKSRLITRRLEKAGFDTRIIERRLGKDLRAQDSESHAVLLGVDNLPTRRLTSEVGWSFAVDVGLGSGPADFSSMLLRRFPGAEPSEQVEAWREPSTYQAKIPNSRAFTELLARGDRCGVVELAGKAVGVPFVGIVAACLAIAEASRELHGGVGLDILTYDLATLDLRAVNSTTPADVVSSPLRTASGDR